MEPVKVSIIVPVYNVEKYIKECIDSLLEQTFDNYEVVVINDGTLDNSMEYVRQMQKKHSNIVIVDCENGGLSVARNIGLETAKGEYIIFCDSDDAIERNSLEVLYKEAMTYSADIVMYDKKTIRNINGQWIEDEGEYYERTSAEVMSGEQMYVKLMNNNEYNASACLFMIRKELLDKNNLRFYPGILHEDELFTPQLLILAPRAIYRNWKLYNRFMREGSITTRTDNIVTKARCLYIVAKELDKWNKEKLLNLETQNILEHHMKQHMQLALGYYSQIKYFTPQQKEEKKQAWLFVREKKWNLGIIFLLYLLKEKIKTVITI